MGEEDLLPQGDTVPKDAQEHKDELKRIEKYVIDLQQRVMTQCEKFSDDVKYWAEYRTGIKELKDRYSKVKLISDEWMKKAETLIKEWKLLDNTVNELNSWVATDRGEASEQNFSLEKMESTLGELKNIFKEKERLVDNL